MEAAGIGPAFGFLPPGSALCLSAKLTELGGTTESHEVTDEALEEAHAADTTVAT